MTATTSTRSRSRGARITARVGALAVVLVALFGTGSAEAATRVEPTYKGDFGPNGTAMKRLAVCAFAAYENDNQSGDKLTRCNNAASDKKYDSLTGWAENLAANNGVLIDAQKVAAQGGKCPSMRGYSHIKCFYVGGKGAKGRPVMTVSAGSDANFAGGTALISWYYQ